MLRSRMIEVVVCLGMILATALPALAQGRRGGFDLGIELPDEQRFAVFASIRNAGDNREELIKALKETPEAQRAAMVFLIANMPERDATTLSAAFLLDHVKYAYKAREESPWGKTIPEEIFLNYVLPYANINEKRDPWREEFYEAFMPIALESKSMAETAVRLNTDAFDMYNVKYHATQRPKPDQSPKETIEAGFASCTGLSVMLIDACRAVGIPARFVGTPRWTSVPGNHSWVEVWDGQWRFIGACEAGKLDQTWFYERAAQADPDALMHRIYAASFEDTGMWFPLIWDLKIRYVNAVDVTPFYTHRKTVKLSTPAGETNGGAWVTVRHRGKIVAHVPWTSEVELTLAGGESYTATVTDAAGQAVAEKSFAVAAEGDGAVVALR